MNAVRLNLDRLTHKKESHGVPLTESGGVILGSTGKRPDLKSRIVISRKPGELFVCRVDGQPLQIMRIFTERKYQIGLYGNDRILKMRKVFAEPLAYLALQQQSERDWMFDGDFNDPATGPEDLQRFFNKIANVSLSKKRKKA